MILIGIVLIALSFTLWYYTIPPFTSLGRNNVTLVSAAARKVTFLTSNSTNPFKAYFGSPIDHSFNLSMSISATNGPINVTFYVRDKVPPPVQTNSTVRTIIFDSNLYNNASAARPPNSLIFQNITAVVPSSLLDAFTGGATPYMIIRNLNATSTNSVSFTYSYSTSFRHSDGIPLLLFIVGVIIIIIYGIAFVRRFIKRPRGR